MRDEDLDRIWTEYAGPVFRPKWVLPCLQAIASAAREQEREACALLCEIESEDYVHQGPRLALRAAAKAIRARAAKGAER